MAIVFAGLALALPSTLLNGDSSTHRVTGLYYSELLDDEVSIPSLSAFTYTAGFQELVDATVRVELVRESPFHIQVTTELPAEPRLLTAHKRAIHLLSAEIKEQAMGEVDADLEYLKETRRKASRLDLNRREDEARIALVKRVRPVEVLSAEDAQRLVFLREEIKNLEFYLGGGSLPKTVRARLDRESLNAAEERVRVQQAELSRLAKLFHPSSQTVQAQRGSVEAARSDLTDIEHQLAEIYLRALRLELETLDDKASNRIQSSLANTERTDEALPNADLTLSTGSAWLDDRQKELEARGKAISIAASLEQEGKLTFSVVKTSTQVWTVACWFGALLFLLLAIFSSLGPPKRISGSHGRSQQKGPSNLPRIAPALMTSKCPDQMERFFEMLIDQITGNLNRAPRRLLVLGNSDTEARLAFSIRLANSLGRQVGRVRLVDFDFEQKRLSERLGRSDLPGISELILQGGAVDEFFSSISGTRIQFAPAGKGMMMNAEVHLDRLSQILGIGQDEITIVDAGRSSPISILANHVDAALWATGHSLLPLQCEREALKALRSAGLPLWGVSVESMELFPIP